MDDSYRDEFAVVEVLQEYKDKQRYLVVLKLSIFYWVTAPPPVAKTSEERAVGSFNTFVSRVENLFTLFSKIQGIVAPVLRSIS